MTTASFETTEFRRTFRQETDDLLRKRLIWFISVWGGVMLLLSILTTIMMMNGVGAEFSAVFNNWVKKAFFVVTFFVWVGAYTGSLVLILSKRVQSQTILSIAMGLVVLDGLQGIGARALDINGVPSLMMFVIAHFIACCMFPWTLRQSIIPVALVLAGSAFSIMVFEGGGWVPAVLTTLIYASVTVPGVFISGVKHSQRVQKATNKFLNQRYGMLRQELAYARQVHEALFPAPIATGKLQYTYRYEPMRQIGGDYLYTKMSDDQKRLSVVIVDVTGHGIPAALTVNRLHGEIDIAFAEDAEISPGAMLERLNRYVHLTLAKHSIYATAVCIRVDYERGKVEYASGGHPPAFIRGVDGTLSDLDPTTFVLGACSDEDFDAGQVEVEFHPGDSLIAYTDGAIEARNVEGKMFHIDGLRRLLASQEVLGAGNTSQGLWAERILEEVSAFRGGLPPEDDTLAIEIFRPVGEEIPVPAESAPEAVSV